MSLYTDAVQSIREYSEGKQAELDKLASQARQNTLRVYRELCIEGVDPASPGYAVCNLLANTLSIGREDDFPTVSIPQETKMVILAAVSAGILPKHDDNIVVGGHELYRDASGIAKQQPQWNTDYEFWNAAKQYREKQTWRHL